MGPKRRRAESPKRAAKSKSIATKTVRNEAKKSGKDGEKRRVVTRGEAKFANKTNEKVKKQGAAVKRGAKTRSDPKSNNAAAKNNTLTPRKTNAAKNERSSPTKRSATKSGGKSGLGSSSKNDKKTPKKRTTSLRTPVRRTRRRSSSFSPSESSNSSDESESSDSSTESSDSSEEETEAPRTRSTTLRRSRTRSKSGLKSGFKGSENEGGVSGKTRRKASSKQAALKAMLSQPPPRRAASLNAAVMLQCMYDDSKRGRADGKERDDHKEDCKEKDDEKDEDDEKSKKETKSKESPKETKSVKREPKSGAKDAKSGAKNVESSTSTKSGARPTKEGSRSAATSSSAIPPKKRGSSSKVLAIKDMLVPKRMASLNASALMSAASSAELPVKKRGSSRTEPLNLSTKDDDVTIVEIHDEALKSELIASALKRSNGALLDVARKEEEGGKRRRKASRSKESSDDEEIEEITTEGARDLKAFGVGDTQQQQMLGTVLGGVYQVVHHRFESISTTATAIVPQGQKEDNQTGSLAPRNKYTPLSALANLGPDRASSVRTNSRKSEQSSSRDALQQHTNAYQTQNFYQPAGPLIQTASTVPPTATVQPTVVTSPSAASAGLNRRASNARPTSPKPTKPPAAPPHLSAVFHNYPYSLHYPAYNYYPAPPPAHVHPVAYAPPAIYGHPFHHPHVAPAQHAFVPQQPSAVVQPFYRPAAPAHPSAAYYYGGYHAYPFSAAAAAAAAASGGTSQHSSLSTGVPTAAPVLPYGATPFTDASRLAAPPKNSQAGPQSVGEGSNSFKVASNAAHPTDASTKIDEVVKTSRKREHHQMGAANNNAVVAPLQVSEKRVHSSRSSLRDFRKPPKTHRIEELSQSASTKMSSLSTSTTSVSSTRVSSLVNKSLSSSRLSSASAVVLPTPQKPVSRADFNRSKKTSPPSFNKLKTIDAKEANKALSSLKVTTAATIRPIVSSHCSKSSTLSSRSSSNVSKSSICGHPGMPNGLLRMATSLQQSKVVPSARVVKKEMKTRTKVDEKSSNPATAAKSDSIEEKTTSAITKIATTTDTSTTSSSTTTTTTTTTSKRRPPAPSIMKNLHTSTSNKSLRCSPNSSRCSSRNSSVSPRDRVNLNNNNHMKTPRPLKTNGVATTRKTVSPVLVSWQERNKGVSKVCNGWKWMGKPTPQKIFLNNDSPVTTRLCYGGIQHVSEGDVVRPRHCVLVASGNRNKDLPYVAKVVALFEDPQTGDMLMSLLWYYRPEHLGQMERQRHELADEIYASRHRDVVSVACIEDKCHVMTFNEYCRYRKFLRGMDEGLAFGSWSSSLAVPDSIEGYDRSDLLPTCRVAPDRVFLCRRVYESKHRRILKNPS